MNSRFSLNSARFFAAVLLLTEFDGPRSTYAATINAWNTVGGASWNSAANWLNGHIPNSSEDGSVGLIATSVTSPVTVTLDANQTVYGLTLDPGAGKSIHIDSGANKSFTLALASTDTAPDGQIKFYTINAASGTGNQINAPIQLGDGTSSVFPAIINSFDSTFAIRGGISQATDQTRGVRIVGNSQGIVSYAVAPSTYSGDTTIGNGGILRIDLNNAIPSGAGKGNVVLEGNGQLQFLNATTQSINGLSSTSNTAVVTNVPANNGTTLTLGNNNATAGFAGSINNPSGTGLFSIIKVGTGTQTLSGINSYRGTTTISAGTLLVNGTHNNAGSYTVNVTGAILGGSGTINLSSGSSVTATSGRIAPGNGGPGVLNINGPITMSGIGGINIELGGNTPGNGSGFYDQVNMISPSGAVNATTAHFTINLLNGFVPNPADVFYILTRADAGSFINPQPFDAFPEGATLNFANGLKGKITYQANWTGNQATSTLTGGNDMAIYNVVPEPASGALLCLGVSAIVTWRRRRGCDH